MGGKINFGVMLCSQLFYNKSYAKNCIYTLVKKILYAKLTYCDQSNKNVKYPNLRITKIWVQQK